MITYINDLRQCIDCIGDSNYQLSRRVYPNSRSKFSQALKYGFLNSTISVNDHIFNVLNLELELRLGDAVIWCSPSQASKVLRQEIGCPRAQWEYWLFRGHNFKFRKIVENLQKKGYLVTPKLK